MGRKKYTQQNNLPTISTEPDFHLAVVAFGTERNYRSEALKTIFLFERSELKSFSEAKIIFSGVATATSSFCYFFCRHRKSKRLMKNRICGLICSTSLLAKLKVI